jgi:hypothetical protein
MLGRRERPGVPEFITLKNGLIVNAEAVLLGLRLEIAGHVLTATDGELRVSNGAALTTEDRALIRTYRWHLLEIVGGTYDAA